MMKIEYKLLLVDDEKDIVDLMLSDIDGLEVANKSVRFPLTGKATSKYGRETELTGRKFLLLTPM